MRPVIVALVAAGCGAGHGHIEDPAYIVRATPESRTAISRAVTQALAGIQVTLDPDALTRDGVLVIDRAERRDPRGLVGEGRDPGAPGFSERFHLVKLGEHCVLIHDRTDRHYDLVGAVCAPL